MRISVNFFSQDGDNLIRNLITVLITVEENNGAVKKFYRKLHEDYFDEQKDELIRIILNLFQTDLKQYYNEQ